MKQLLELLDGLTVYLCEVGGFVLCEDDKEPSMSRLSAGHPVVGSCPDDSLSFIDSVVLHVDLCTWNGEWEWRNHCSPDS